MVIERLRELRRKWLTKRARTNETYIAACTTQGTKLYPDISVLVRKCSITVSYQIFLQAFQQARAGAPSILFIDEVESLVGKRSTGSKQIGVHERVLSTLLNEMDGIGLKTEDLQQMLTSSRMIAEGENQGEKVRI